MVVVVVVSIIASVIVAGCLGFIAVARCANPSSYRGDKKNKNQQQNQDPPESDNFDKYYGKPKEVASHEEQQEGDVEDGAVAAATR